MGLEEALRVHTGQPFAASSFVGDGSLVVATRASALASLDARTGDVLWRSVLPQEQSLLGVSFSAQGIASLAATPAPALVLSAWAAKDGAPLWTHQLPLGNGTAAAADASVSSSTVAPAVAAAAGGRLFLFTGAGGQGGEVNGLGTVALAAFDSSGALLVLEAGAKGKLRVHSSASGAHGAMAPLPVPLGGEGARIRRSQGSLALLPTGQPGSAVVAAVGKEGEALLLTWVGAAAASASQPQVLTLRVAEELRGRGAIVSLSQVPVSGATPQAAAACHSHVLALELSTGGRVYVGIDASSQQALHAPGGAASALTLDPSQAPRTTAATVALLPASSLAVLVHSFSAAAAASASASAAPGLSFSTHSIAGGGSSGAPGPEAQAAPLPTAAWPSSTRGAPTLLYALPSTSSAPAGLTLLLVGEDGWVGAAAGGSIAWSSDQSGASVAGALWVEVPARAGSGSSSGAPSTPSPAAASHSLSLPSRLAAQAGALRNIAAALAASLQEGGAEFLSDPAGALLRFVGVRKRAATPGALSGEVPASAQGRAHARALVTLSRTDAGTVAGARATRGVLGIRGVEGGRLAKRWRHALPLGRAARAASASGPLLTSHYTATLLPSRPASNSLHGSSEVLLVESTPSAQGSGYTVECSWVSAATGEVALAGSWLAPAPPTTLAQLPFTLAADGRHAYAALPLLNASSSSSSSAAFLPASALPALRALGGSAYVSVRPMAGGRGLEGFSLGSSSGSGSSSGGADAIAHGDMAPLWAAPLAPCAGASPSADAVLAVVHTPAGSSSLYSSEALLAGGGVSPPLRPRAKILPGDDSVLLKYQNPNLLAVAVGTPGKVAGEWEVQQQQQQQAGSSGGEGCSGTLGSSSSSSSVTVLLMDAVTGRVLHSRRHADASGPVSLALHDNWVVYSYWSTAAQRSEIGVATLFEHTAVNTYDIAPWAKLTPATSSVLSTAPLTAYGLPSPYVLHKVYVPPMTVKGLSFLASRHDVTPPALLISTASDGELAVGLC